MYCYIFNWSIVTKSNTFISIVNFLRNPFCGRRLHVASERRVIGVIRILINHLLSFIGILITRLSLSENIYPSVETLSILEFSGLQAYFRRHWVQGV